MTKILAFLDGKKTYLIVVAFLVVSILQSQGVEIPEYIWIALNGLGLGFLRVGVKKVGLAAHESAKTE